MFARALATSRTTTTTSSSARAFASSSSSALSSSSSSSAARRLLLAAGGAAAGYALWQSIDDVSADGYAGTPGTAQERTFIACKPDAVARGLVGKIVARFEERGYKLVALKMVRPTPEFAAEHYADLSKKPFFNGLCRYFASGPVVAMVWEGKGAIKGGRALVGATNPADSLPGSIRGDMCIEVGRNIVHGSDAPDSANDEIKLWFRENEVHQYTRADAAFLYEKV